MCIRDRVSFIFLTFGFHAFANVHLPAIFTDHMVLQRNAEVNIWGNAEPNEEITLKADFLDKEIKVKANSEAKFKFVFNTPKEGGPVSYTHLDVYKRQLWDNAAQKIAGAYRMALGCQVMKKYGMDGFYTGSLFEFDQEIQPFFRKVIEMGRAYISLEYQQKPLPLFLLWRGIVHVCLKNPEHKFLMGCLLYTSRCV